MGRAGIAPLIAGGLDMRLSRPWRTRCGFAVGVGVLSIAAAGTASAATPDGVVSRSRVVVQAGPPAVRATTPPVLARPKTLTPVQLSFDNRHGIVPLRGGGSTLPTALTPRGSAPCEVTCSAIHMSYFDGPVLSNAKVEGVFWGTGNYTAGAGPGGEMPAFYNAVGGSDYWAGLSEYNTTVSGGTNQFISPVSSLSEITITPSPVNDGSTITDSEIQAELSMQLASASLPAPTLDSTGNVNTLYALYFPDSKILCLDDAGTQCSNNVFCAYHGTISYNGMDVPYMVMPAFTPSSPAATGGCGTLPTLTDDYTSVVSHELVEATTDTAVGLVAGASYAFPSAWASNQTVGGVGVGEVMDACQAGSNLDSSTLPSTSFYVQAIWSNQAAACIFSRTYLNLTPTTATIPAGGTQTYKATTDGPTDVSGSTTFTISPSNGASCTGDVCTASLPGSYTVQGMNGGVSSDTVNLTVVTGCAPGTYSATGSPPCTAAPPGYYVASSGATAATPCALGTYNALSGQTSCTTAPAGTYVDTMAATAPTDCPAGSYNPSTGATSGAACLAAPAGTYVPSPGSAAPTNCPVGTFSPATGATSCTPAHPGYFVPSAGSSFETQCPAGKYSAASGAVACKLADPGSFVPHPASTGETPCLAGSFSAASSAVACTLADPGSFVASPGSTGETRCAAGSFSASSGAVACRSADPGSFVDSPGSTAETKCPAGSFSASSGATSCEHAPPGSFVAGIGASSATKCTLGTFSPISGATSCRKAPLNTYVDTLGAVAATACPAHTFTLKTGSTSKSACLYLAITTTALPHGTLYSDGSVKYYAKLAAKGGTRPYIWSLVHGLLPPGLKLDASTGVISGKATKTGTYVFTIKVKDTATSSQPLRTAEATLSIKISK